MVGPGCPRHVPGVTGWSFNVGAAEDDDAKKPRPQAAGNQQYDAVDDAHDVYLFVFFFPQRAGSILGNINCYWRCYAVLCYRLGGPGPGNGWKASYRGQEVKEIYCLTGSPAKNIFS